MNQDFCEQNEPENESELDKYVLDVWKDMEGFFHVLEHGDIHYVSSYEGAHNIIWIFKDWVENNGGWKDIQNCNSKYKEEAIHRWIQLGAKTYLVDQDLDMNCETNIGVGQEDIKISRGNDKTIIEVKLSSNPNCKHGYETQLPRYAEAEHTKNMIYVLIRVDEIEWDLRKKNTDNPDIVVIDARQQKSASKL